jgi:hypothetical protein
VGKDDAGYEEENPFWQLESKTPRISKERVRSVRGAQPFFILHTAQEEMIMTRSFFGVAF